MRLLAIPAALSTLLACETPVPTTVGCEVELATRAELVNDTVEVEVWVTNLGETRVLSIPNCVGVTLNAEPIQYCTPDGEPDPTQCEPGTFELRSGTSLQVAFIDRPVAGDVCNDPLESGQYDVALIGIETGEAEVCRLYDILVVP